MEHCGRDCGEKMKKAAEGNFFSSLALRGR